MSFVKALLTTALISVAGFSGHQQSVQESQDVNVQEEESSQELIVQNEQVIEISDDLFSPLEKRSLTPLHSDLLDTLFKTNWQYCEISFTPSGNRPGIPGSIGYGYRTLGKVHGWDASVHLDYFSVVFIPDFGSFVYQAISTEFSYLPHAFFNNTAVYFGVGGGGGVGKGLFGSHRWELFPIFYLKPGVQFALDGNRSKMLSIDLKIGLPKLISLDSGIAF